MELKDYKELIEMALNEDLLDDGDITSEAIFGQDDIDTFFLISKDDGVLCGVQVFTDVFKYVDETVSINFNFKDGDRISKDDTIATIKGKVISILNAERTAINFISHLSGVATKTNIFVSATDGKIKILDTRKTLPGYRMLQKYAVKCGGGNNHRIGLYDMVMIKDNHIDASGSITEAVDRVRKKWKNLYKIEVETRNLEEVREALSCQVDRIMLDNMHSKTMIDAINIVNKEVEIEASGNMSLERLKELHGLGIDYISFGELTHTVKAFDFSIKKS